MIYIFCTQLHRTWKPGKEIISGRGRSTMRFSQSASMEGSALYLITHCRYADNDIFSLMTDIVFYSTGVITSRFPLTSCKINSDVFNCGETESPYVRNVDK